MGKFTWQFQKLWLKMLKTSVSRMNSHSTRKAMERLVGKTEEDSRPRIRLLTLICLLVKSVTFLFRILTSFFEKKKKKKKCCYPLQNWMLPCKGNNCNLIVIVKIFINESNRKKLLTLKQYIDSVLLANVYETTRGIPLKPIIGI